MYVRMCSLAAGQIARMCVCVFARVCEWGPAAAAVPNESL